MKKSALFFFLCFVTVSYGQPPFVTNWNLFEMNLSGQNIPLPNNAEVHFVSAMFSPNNPDVFDTGVCNAISGEVDVDEYNATITFPQGLSITLFECNNPDNTSFEDMYYNFLNTTIPINYEITYIDGPPGPDEVLLWITKPNGDYIIYSDLQYYFSTPDFDLSSIFVYPNPEEIVLEFPVQIQLF